MLNFLTAAAETTGTTGSTGGLLGSPIIMIVLMIALLYFMMIRPEKKRKKEAEELRSSVKVGDSIVTIGGVCGTVVDVKEDKFVMETGADRVRVEFQKWALSTNETAVKAAEEEAKKKAEAKAKAKAAKKAKKNID